MFRLTLATRLALSMTLFATGAVAAGAGGQRAADAARRPYSFRRKPSCNSG